MTYRITSNNVCYTKLLRSTQKLFEIRDFYEDLDSTLWIGTGDGLFYYDRDRQVILKAAYDQEEFEKFGEIHAILSYNFV